uniref:Transmembrane protein 45B n=1 Tax=Trichobilharzia regenti TaxID=157069 RepID=A0AA85KAK5_TRIRE|nr:unnamed protein product [Trichobilharzia regenti]
MGTFGGHALPGSFFILYGLWSIWHILETYYRRKLYELNKCNEFVPEFTNRISYPLNRQKSNDYRGCCKKSIPFDSLAKFICCIGGITGEVITGFNSDWVFVHIGNIQHSSMFSLFGLSGLIEVFVFYGILKIPRESEYLFNMIALLGEFFLFMFHLHGRSPLDIYLHLLLAGMIVLAVGISLAELMAPREPVYGLMRCWTYLMQGTWFWQVGAILYPKFSWMPTWNENAIESLPAAANLFAYHMLANLFAIIVIVFIVMIRCKVGIISEEKMKTRLLTAATATIRKEYQERNSQQQTQSQQKFIADNDSEEIEMWNYHRSDISSNKGQRDS